MRGTYTRLLEVMIALTALVGLLDAIAGEQADLALVFAIAAGCAASAQTPGQSGSQTSTPASQTAPAAAAEPKAALPRVHLVATGGTISNRDGGRLTADELAANGIGPGTVRVSVGLEHTEDIVDDFVRALDEIP